MQIIILMNYDKVEFEDNFFFENIYVSCSVYHKNQGSNKNANNAIIMIFIIIMIGVKEIIII